MRRALLLNYIIGVSTFLISCSKTVDINRYIDSKQNLVLFNISDSDVILNRSNSSITPHDIRYSMLLNWGKENVNDWEYSTVSYVKQYGIVQKNFNLSVNNELVIINLNSTNQQYVKRIKKNELLFLLDSIR